MQALRRPIKSRDEGRYLSTMVGAQIRSPKVGISYCLVGVRPLGVTLRPLFANTLLLDCQANSGTCHHLSVPSRNNPLRKVQLSITLHPRSIRDSTSLPPPLPPSPLPILSLPKSGQRTHQFEPQGSLLRLWLFFAQGV